MMQMGKVWLVGSGPGDGGLMTVKGKRVLEQAQVVVYDALIGESMLNMISPDARQIYVGKRSGNHVKDQQEINEILVEEAKKGYRVVRLKGGDPFVFGRGSEEILRLKEEGIPFELVPGVTAAVAVPEYAGIPITHRGVSSSFHVFTGHAKNGESVKLDFKTLAKLSGTLIFLMGVSAVSDICQGLIEAGMDRRTPAAVVHRGTTARQRSLVSSLEQLPEEIEKQKFEAPSVILVGDACAMEKECHWTEAMPLFGVKVLVTRPRRMASRLSGRLRDMGAEVVELSTAEPRLLSDSRELKSAAESLERYQWLAFTSPSGVELFFEYLQGLHMDIRCLSRVKIAVIGPATGEELKKKGIYPDYQPERYYAKDLGEGLAGIISPKERLLILRAEKGSPLLLEPLDRNGVFYDDVALYETVYPEHSYQAEHVRRMLSEGSIQVITFTSASTVEGFMKIVRPDGERLRQVTALCIGTQTEKKASSYGMKTLTSKEPSMAGMAEALLRFCQTGG